MVRQALETYLRNEPAKVSKSRIKRLKGLSEPQYRLRVGDVRVFYDVSERAVEVLAIVAKGDTEEWLQKAGEAQ
jgi:mRNA interferase RelE/StbE